MKRCDSPKSSPVLGNNFPSRRFKFFPNGPRGQATAARIRVPRVFFFLQVLHRDRLPMTIHTIHSDWASLRDRVLQQSVGTAFEYLPLHGRTIVYVLWFGYLKHVASSLSSRSIDFGLDFESTRCRSPPYSGSWFLPEKQLKHALEDKSVALLLTYIHDLYTRFV